MKTIIPKVSALAFGICLLGAAACGGEGCGQPASSGADQYTQPPVVRCGPGTVQQGDRCVAVSSTNGTTSTRRATTLSTEPRP